MKNFKMAEMKRWLKTCLKKKVSFDDTSVVRYCLMGMAGLFIATALPLYAANHVSIGTTDGTTISTSGPTNANKDDTKSPIYIGPGILGAKGEGEVLIGTGVDNGNALNSVAIGRFAKITGNNGVAIGAGAQAGTLAVAIGAANSPSQIQTDGANATGRNSVALGAGSRATTEDAIAIGKYSVADRAAGVQGIEFKTNNGGATTTQDTAAWKSTLGSFAVGSSTNTRQITGVAAGSQDTDAVNLAQLKSAAPKYFSVNSEIAENRANNGATGSDAIAIGPNVSTDAKDSVVIGKESRNTNGPNGGYSTVTIGNEALNYNSYSSVSIGHKVNVDNARESVLVGNNSKIGNMQSVGIGKAIDLQGDYAIGIGNNIKSANLQHRNAGIGQDITLGTNATYAMAIGRTVTVNAEHALAIGNNTTASGTNSIALGKGAQASGNDSLALGTSAKADGSFIETIAIGKEAYAGERAAVAIGPKSEVKSMNSIAIGADYRFPSKVGPNSGWSTVIGNNSKIETSTDATLVGPSSTITDSKHATLVGSSSTITGSKESSALGSQLSVNNSQSSLALGRGTKLTNSKQSIAISTYINGNDRSELTGSEWTVGIGNNVKVEGSNDAVALGSNIRVNNAASAVAIGNGANTTKAQAIAIGKEAAATESDAIATGTGSKAATRNSIAVGQGAVVNGVSTHDSIAIGKAASVKTTATTPTPNAEASTSMAIGSQAAVLDSSRAVVIGDQAKSEKSNVSVVIGYKAQAVEANSKDSASAVVIGNQSEAAGSRFAVVMGYQAKSTSQHGSVAIGRQTKASGDSSIAIGMRHAEIGGNGATLDPTTASGSWAIAIGNHSSATQDSSVAMGAGAQSEGVRAVAVGNYVKATAIDSFVFGAHSEATAGYAVVIGKSAKASAGSATAIGKDAEASGAYSIAMGEGANASSTNAVVIGKGAQTTGAANYGIAIGDSSKVTAARGVAVGEAAVANVGSGKIGYDILTDAESTAETPAWKSVRAAFSVGSRTYTNDNKFEADKISRQIINVAAGTEDTDAVNVAQLKNIKLKYKANGGDQKTATIAQGFNFTTDTPNVLNISAEDDGVVKFNVNVPSQNLKFKDGNNTERTVAIGTGAVTHKEKEVDKNIKVELDTAEVGQPVYKYSIKENPEFAGTVKATNGFDANGAKIINVAEATIDKDSKEAVSGKQLHATNVKLEEVENKIAGNLANVKAISLQSPAVYTYTDPADGREKIITRIGDKYYRPEDLDPATGKPIQETDPVTGQPKEREPVQVQESDVHVSIVNNRGTGSVNNPMRLSNISEGKLSPTSKDAVNGKQLHDVANKLGIVDTNGNLIALDVKELKNPLGNNEAKPTNVVDALNKAVDKMNAGLKFRGNQQEANSGAKVQYLGSQLDVVAGDVSANGTDYVGTNLKTEYRYDAATGNGTISIGMTEKPKFKEVEIQNPNDPTKTSKLGVDPAGNLTITNNAGNNASQPSKVLTEESIGNMNIAYKAARETTSKQTTLANGFHFKAAGPGLSVASGENGEVTYTLTPASTIDKANTAGDANIVNAGAVKNLVEGERVKYVSIKGGDSDKAANRIGQSNYNNDGATGFSSMAIGRNTSAKAAYSMAIGTGSAVETDGVDSIVIGNYSATEAPESLVLGNFATSTTPGGVAIGNRSNANVRAGLFGHNFDYDNETDYLARENKQAELDRINAELQTERAKPQDQQNEDKIRQLIGDRNKLSSAWKSTQGAVAVGNSVTGETRQITGVAAGVHDFDAVNVAQYKHLADRKFTYTDGANNTFERKNSEIKTLTIKEDAINGGYVAENLKVELSTNPTDQTNGIYKIGLKEDVKFNSVTAENPDGTKTKITKDGITITYTTPTTPDDTTPGEEKEPEILVSLTKEGLNNGGKKITNVADGVDEKDAVNKKQLDALGNNTIKLSAMDNTSTDTQSLNKENGLEFKIVGEGVVKTTAENDTIKVSVETTNLSTTNGEVDAPAAADETKLVTAGNVARAINTAAAAAKTEVKSDDGTITVEESTGANNQKIYDVKIATTTLTVDQNGTVTAGDENKTVTAGNLADTFNTFKESNKLIFAGDSGTNVERKLTETLNIKGGVTDTANLTDNNIGVVANETDGLTIKLAKNITGLTSLETKDDDGNSTVQNGTGITITPVEAGKSPVSLTKDGLNNGGNTITNVASALQPIPDTDTKKAGLINLDNLAEGTDKSVATVGDIQKMGFVVSSDKTTGTPENLNKEFSNKVKNADEVRFVGTGATVVSGKTDENGVNVFTVSTSVAKIEDSSPISYTNADGDKVVKVGDKFYKADDIDDQGNPKPEAQEVPVETVENRLINPNGSKDLIHLENLKSTLTPITAANSQNAAPDTKDKIAEMRSNQKTLDRAATVGDVLNTGFNLQLGGVAKDFVRHGDIINFVNGTNTTVNIVSTPDGLSNTIRIDVDKEISLNTINVGQPSDDKNGNPGVDGVVNVSGKDGSGVSLNGKDGSIGLKGTNGSNAMSITTGNGQPGVDGVGNPATGEGSTRIKYTPANGQTEEVATLNDGLKFTGNNGAVENKHKLNSLVKVVGERDDNKTAYTEEESAKNNIIVEADGADKLTVKLAKELKNITSASGGANNKSKIELADDKVVIGNDGKNIEISPDGDNAKITGLDGTRNVKDTNDYGTGDNAGRVATEGAVKNLANDLNKSFTFEDAEAASFTRANNEGDKKLKIVAGNIGDAGAETHFGENLKVSLSTSEDGKTGTYTVGLKDKLNLKEINLADDAGNKVVQNGAGTTTKDAAGNETKQEAGKTTIADAAGNKTEITKDGITITPANPAEGKGPVSLTKDGLNNGGNKITNVADGNIANDSKELVNGKQLKDLADKVGIPLAEGSTTEFKTPTITPLTNVAGTNESAPTTILGGLNSVIGKVNEGITFGADVAAPTTNVNPGKQQLGSKLEVVTGNFEIADANGGDAISYKNENIKTTYKVVDGNGVITIGFKENPVFKELETKDGQGNSTVQNAEGTTTKDAAGNETKQEAGKTTIADADGNKTEITKDGITITPANPAEGKGAVSLTKDGLNNGGNKITNVASGLTPVTEEGKTKGLVDLKNLPAGTDESTVVTVGDIQKMGFVVSSNKTTGNLGEEFSNHVKNADEVRFEGAGAAVVSGKTDENGVNVITVDVNVKKIEENSPITYTNANNEKLVKIGDKFYKAADIDDNGKPKAGAQELTPEEKAGIKNSLANADGTNSPTYLDNLKNTLTPAADDDAKKAPNTTEEVKNMRNEPNVANRAATVGDVLNTGFNLQNNGDEKDFVRHADNVNFINGKNTTAVVENTDGVTSTIKFDLNPELKDINSISGGADNKSKIELADDKVVIGNDGKNIEISPDGDNAKITGLDPNRNSATEGYGTGDNAGRVATEGAVKDLANKLGDASKDLTDPKLGDNTAAGKDGLNGKDAVAKTNALRNGEAGPTVFTTPEGDRVVRGEDGKLYKADDIKDKVPAKDGKDGKIVYVDRENAIQDPKTGEWKLKPEVNPENVAKADPIDPTNVILSNAGPTGDTTTPTGIGNVASALGTTKEPKTQDGKKVVEPITADEAKNIINGDPKNPDKGGLLTQNDPSILNRAATVSDLQALAQAGHDFGANTGEDIHRPLGTKVSVVGEEPKADKTYATTNVTTETNVEENKIVIKLAEKPEFKGMDLVAENPAGTEPTKITMTPTSDGTLKLSKSPATGDQDPKDDKVVIAGLKDGDTPDSAVTKGALDKLAEKLGDASKDATDTRFNGETTAAKDGLNGKDAVAKTNALRNGEAGPVVFTTKAGDRVVRGEDGKLYKADDIKDSIFDTATNTYLPKGTDGNPVPNSKAVEPINPTNVILSNTGPTGDTKTPTGMGNIASGLGLSKENGDKFYEMSKNLTVNNPIAELIYLDKENEPKVNNAATIGDLRALGGLGFNYEGNTEIDENKTDRNIHRAIGGKIFIQGEGTNEVKNFESAAGNIQVVSDKGASTLTVKLSEKIQNLTSIETKEIDPENGITSKVKLDGKGLEFKGTDGNTTMKIDGEKGIITGIKDYEDAPMDSAVSRGYVDARFDDLRDKAQKLNDGLNKAMGGIASAVAMATLTQVEHREGYRNQISVGTGSYGGEQAIAVGFSGVSKKGKVVYKASGSLNSRGKAAVGAAVGIQFNKDPDAMLVNTIVTDAGLQEKVNKLEERISSLAPGQQFKEQLYTIDNYINDSSELTGTQIVKLKAIVNEINEKYSDRIIDITGYTDLPGNEKYNLELGLKRANTIEDYMIQFGLKNPQNIRKVSSFGYNNRVNEVNKSNNSISSNRRVEILVK